MDIQKLLNENKIKIREDDSRVKQSLMQFHDWLDKHPFIKNCRRDDSYLMQFLRTRKFSMDDVFKTFESNMLMRTARPDWFDTSDKSLELIGRMAETRALYMLRKRAPDGSLVIVANLANADLENYTTDNAFNYVYNMLAAFAEIEENQILGCTFVTNYVGCPLKVIASFSIRDAVDFTKSASKLSGRFKKFISIGLPSAAITLLNASKAVMTEKQRDRLILVKDYDELAQHIDKSALTDRFGGPEPEDEVVAETVKVIKENFRKLKEINNFELDVDKAAAYGKLNESVGSFRKLDID